VIAAPPGPGTGITHVVTPGQLLGAPAPGQGGQVRLAAGGATPAVGDALNAGIGPTTPYGMLVRVTGVSYAAGGAVVANTVPARLDEVLPDGRLAPTIPISAQTPQPRLGRAATVVDADCEGSAGLQIHGEAEIDGTVEPVLEWGILKPKRAGLIASASASASAGADASAAGSCSVDDIELLDRTLAPVTFAIGPLLVVLVPTVEVSLSGSIEASAEMGAGVSAGITARAGLIREDGDFTKIAEVEPSLSHSITPPTAAGSANGSVTAELSVLVYGAVGPEVTLESGLHLGVDTTKEPWWWLDGTIGASASIDLPILDLSSGSLELYSRTFRLAEAPRRLVDVTVTTATARLTGSGGGAHSGEGWTRAGTIAFDGSLVQRGPASATGLASESSLDVRVPVRFAALPAARSSMHATNACGTGSGSQVTTWEQVPATGGTGNGVIGAQIEFDDGQPVGLVVPDAKTRADEALQEDDEEGEVLMGRDRLTIVGCEGGGASDVTAPIPHNYYFDDQLTLESEVRVASPPETTVALLGCDAEGTCTYKATYSRSFTLSTGGGAWSSSSNVELEAYLTVAFRID
jgi:hypothetical protein